VLAGILLVTSKRGVLKESLYVLGWLIALSVVFAISVSLYPGTPGAATSQTPLHIGEIVLGLLLAILLLVRWRKPGATQRATEPAWMAKLDSMSPLLALALGAFLPNYVVVVAAAGEVLQLKASTTVVVIAAICFILLASIGVAAPLAVRVFRGKDSARIYANWRAWLVGHSRAVSYATGAVVALVLIVKGIVGLLT
jgi:hypothetical protein